MTENKANKTIPNVFCSCKKLFLLLEFHRGWQLHDAQTSCSATILQNRVETWGDSLSPQYISMERCTQTAIKQTCRDQYGVMITGLAFHQSQFKGKKKSQLIFLPGIPAQAALLWPDVSIYPFLTILSAVRLEALRLKHQHLTGEHEQYNIHFSAFDPNCLNKSSLHIATSANFRFSHNLLHSVK